MVEWEGGREDSLLFVLSGGENKAWLRYKSRFLIFDVNWRQKHLDFGG
jgi:hypothetical protein